MFAKISNWTQLLNVNAAEDSWHDCFMLFDKYMAIVFEFLLKRL